MTATVETWKSYAQLLARLSPRISHVLFASADGTSSWSSDPSWSNDPSSETRVQRTLSSLVGSHSNRHSDIDGLAETEGGVHSLIKPALDDAIQDLPLYGCFATSTGLFDPAIGKTAALRG
jgi:hypothetical protein